MNIGRKKCVMVGRCYTVALAYLLSRSEQFRREYNIVLFSSVATPSFRPEFPRIVREISEAALVLYQPAAWATWIDDDLHEQFTSSLVDKERKISFPYPVFLPLWPFNYNDTKRAASSVGPFENKSLLYGYGDANVVRMVKEGLTPAEIVERYSGMELSEMIDLERLKSNIIASQRPKEAETDIKVLDFILENYKLASVFSCVNHGSNLLLLHMVNQILRMLGYSPLSKSLLERIPVLAEPEIPIHPSVARYFDLKWLTPEMRFHVDRYRNLTFAEYIYELAQPD
jgi:hypothetical protein